MRTGLVEPVNPSPNPFAEVSMSHSLRAAAAGLLLAALALPLAAQDSTMMKHDMAKEEMKEMPGHGMMMPHGMFAGMHDHTVKGAVELGEKDGKAVLRLGSDFSLDGAPDPYVVLTSSGMGSGAGTLNLGRLRHKQGAAEYAIPAGTDLKRYTQAIIWCKKYNVTLGQADLAAGDLMMHN